MPNEWSAKEYGAFNSKPYLLTKRHVTFTNSICGYVLYSYQTADKHEAGVHEYLQSA